MSLYRAKNNTEVYCEIVDEKKPSEFPQSWFTSNPGKKPSLVVHKATDLTQTKKMVMASTKGNSVNVNHVVTFLYYTLKDIQVVSNRDVISYGLELCKKDEPTSIFHLVEVVEKEPDTSDADTAEVGNISDKCMVLWLLSLYRLEKVSDKNYKDQLTRHMNDALVQLGAPNNWSFLNAISSNPGWFKSMDYRKIVACVDHFFFHHEYHDWANLRLATIGSRFRDCSALLSIGQCSKLLGLPKAVDLLEWICDDHLANELEAMLANREEIDKPFSYFPYQIDLGLVMRSAYSARMSPAVHTFCHIIGTMFGHMRSVNARYFLEVSIKNVIRNAQWVAYAFYQASNNKKQFSKTPQTPATQPVATIQVDNSQGDDLPDADMEPTTLNPDDWIDYMELNNWKLTAQMLKYVEGAHRDNPSPRPGTIGDLVGKQIFLTA